MKIARESGILIAICLADLLSTLWFVHYLGASEGNPVMRFYLEQGVLPFVAAKLVLFLGPLAILEWARRRHPRFVRAMLRTGILLYIGSYGVVVWRINQPGKDGSMSVWQAASIVRECSRPVDAADLALLRERMRSRQN